MEKLNGVFKIRIPYISENLTEQLIRSGYCYLCFNPRFLSVGSLNMEVEVINHKLKFRDQDIFFTMFDKSTFIVHGDNYDKLKMFLESHCK